MYMINYVNRPSGRMLDLFLNIILLMWSICIISYFISFGPIILLGPLGKKIMSYLNTMMDGVYK